MITCGNVSILIWADENQKKALFRRNEIILNVFQLVQNIATIMGKKGVENTYKYKNNNSKIPLYPFWSKNN